MAEVKPNFPASFKRDSVWATGRSAPDSEISPNTTVSVGRAASSRALSSAQATARSAAGSVTRRPPATLR